MTVAFGITAAALALIIAATLYIRRHPAWHGYEPAHAPGGRPSPRPAAGPARRDWGESRLPSAAERTAELAAIGERVMPGGHAPMYRPDQLLNARHDTPDLTGPLVSWEPINSAREGSADLDQFLAPWPPAAEPVTPEPDLEPLPPPLYLPAPVATHAPPDVAPGRVHDGCEISDMGQQAALTALSEPVTCGRDCPEHGDLFCDSCGVPLVPAPGGGYRHADRDAAIIEGCPEVEDWTESDQAICLCGKVPDIPGEPVTSEADCPAHGTEPPWCRGMSSLHRMGEDLRCTTCQVAGCNCSACARDGCWGCACHDNDYPDVSGGGVPYPEAAPDATLTDMRPVPAPVAARENAAGRWHLRAYVSYTMARKPPLREYIEETIGISPAEDFENVLAEARAGAMAQ